MQSQPPNSSQLAAAMMWQLQMGQMAGAHQQASQMMMPPWPPPMPMMAPTLMVRVEGLKFEYQLTEDDVRKVFARYGEVAYVNVEKEGTAATVQLAQPAQAVAAQSDLDNKQLAGMSGAFLRVEYAPSQAYNPALAQMAAAAAAQSFNPMMPPVPGGMPGYPMGMQQPPMPGSPLGSSGRGRKNTCKLEVGIENESEFRVGSRVIQIARQIWQDQDFQNHGGKTRLRGKGIGGPHEADEPLALCISCSDQGAFDKAVAYAEGQLQKVQKEYITFCEQHGKAVPAFDRVKMIKKGAGSRGGGVSSTGGGEVPRGERPDSAPTDAEIEGFIEERNEARKSQKYERADEVREYLKSVGVVLMDEKAAKGNFKGNEVTKWRFWRP